MPPLEGGQEPCHANAGASELGKKRAVVSQTAGTPRKNRATPSRGAFPS